MSNHVEEQEGSAVPVDVELDPEIQHRVEQATGEFFEKASTLDLTKALKDEFVPQAGRGPKSWFMDPFALLDSVGMGYRSNPTSLTYETLRQMTERDTLCGAIITTRLNQVASFCRPQENKYSIGFEIRLRNRRKRRRRMSESERERADHIEHFMLNMGTDYNIGRQGFEQFTKAVLRDRLTYDQVCAEKERTYGGIRGVYAVDASSIRLAHTQNPKAGPPITHRQRHNETRYVQIVSGEIANEYTMQDLAFAIANPRTSLRVGGYGFPEPAMLLTTVTAHLWAEEWNRRAFSQGSTIKGVLNLRGSISREQFEAYKRQWYSQVGGINNAWRTPVMNSDGIEFVPVQMSNTEMGYQLWLEYLIKVGCAIYQMDPAEINFDLRGSSQQQPIFMSTNEAQQKVSQDRGLRPLLRFYEDFLNRHVVWAIDDRFELAFVGLDAKTEEQAIELRLKQGQSTHTINELRELEDLPPIEKGGDIIMNPTFTGYLLQKEQAEQMQQGGGMPGMPGGGGMPGMPGGGQDDGEQEQQQPYQNKMSLPPGDEEKEAKARLREHLHGEKKGQNMKPSSFGLHNNDWETSVHASVQDSDLKKAMRTLEIEFDDLEL